MGTKSTNKVIINTTSEFSTVPSSVLEHAQVCECTRNQDEQRRAQSLAEARASPARTHRCHGPLARACLLAAQCQPPQSSETQMCKLGLCQYVLWTCGGSSRGM